MTSRAPRKLGKWTVLETLGKGGFSKVRLGLDEATGERVALKILKKKEMGLTSDVIRQVEREIHAMQMIQHPNVLQLKDVQWDCMYEKKNGTKIPVILVVLELATGGELFDFLSFTGPFEEAIARTYFQQLMAGIAHCHSKGIAHRDIKPENLLISGDFLLKLADFGFAASFANATAANQAMFTECGTPGYMAPEVFASSKGFDRKGYDGAAADIWSCGVVLFIQLAGFPPFQRPALNDWWFHKLANGKHHLFWEAHQRTAYFSDLVKDFLNKLLCPDPAKRMRMEELLKHPWVLGPTIAHSALQAELQRRKHAVEQAKGAERAQKEAQKHAEEYGHNGAIPAQAGLLERGDVSMTRGHGATPHIDALSESLPAVNPSITSFAMGLQPAPKVGDGHDGGAENALGESDSGAVMGADAFGSSEGGECYEGDEGECGESSAAVSSSAASGSAAAESTPLPPLFPPTDRKSVV